MTSKKVSIDFSEEQKKFLEEQAQLNGLALSSYLRFIILNNSKLDKVSFEGVSNGTK